MKKIVLMFMLCFCTFMVACGGSENVDKKEQKLSCSESVINSDYDDCVVQVYDMVFDLDTDDVTNPMYFFDKIENSSYDFELTATAEGLVQAGDSSGVDVIYSDECLMSFYVDNNSDKTTGIKDCKVSTIIFYPIIYSYYELYDDDSAPTVSNMWFAKGTPFYNSEVTYGDLMESIDAYSPKEYARKEITKIFIKVLSEKSKHEIEYKFYVDNDNGMLKHSFVRIKVK